MESGFAIQHFPARGGPARSAPSSPRHPIALSVMDTPLREEKVSGVFSWHPLSRRHALRRHVPARGGCFRLLTVRKFWS
jgi:hypothetical protein